VGVIWVPVFPFHRYQKKVLVLGLPDSIFDFYAVGILVKRIYDVMKLDISIGNQEILAFLGDDLKGLFETDYLDAIFGALEVFLGYMLGKFMLKRFEQRQLPSSQNTEKSVA
jgi:hypothetical protein